MSGMKESASGHLRGNRNSEFESGFNRRCPGERRWWKIPRRYQVSLMCFCAFFIKGWMIANLWTIFVHIFMMPLDEQLLHFPKSENWTLEDLETMFDLNFWGGAIMQFPSAALTLYFSPNCVMLLSVLFSSVLHLTIPALLHASDVGLMIALFLEGVATAPLSCACMGLWKEWAPESERASLLVLAYSGNIINLHVTFSLSAYLVEHFGPVSGYNIVGITGIVWCLLWNTLIYSSPDSDPLMTEEELNYLEERIPTENKEKIPLKAVPVKSILLSPPVLSLCGVFFTVSFLKKVIYLAGIILNTDLIAAHYDISWHEWVQSVFFILMIPTSGFLADFLTNRKFLKTSTARKLCCCGGFVLHAIFLFLTLIPYPITSAVFNTLAYLFVSLTLTGYVPNILELSPRYACVIAALCVTASQLSSILFDVVVEAVTNGSGLTSHESWQDVLIPSGVLGLVTALIYGFFASSDEQGWSVPSRRTNDSHCYPRNEAEDETLVTEHL